MKKLLLITLLAITFFSCKKSDNKPTTTTLKVSAYIVDSLGIKRPAKSDIYLFPTGAKVNLNDGETWEVDGQTKSVLGWSDEDAYNKSGNVNPGSYTIAVQISAVSEGLPFAGMFSYKTITLKSGDQISSTIVFHYPGNAFNYQQWEDN